MKADMSTSINLLRMFEKDDADADDVFNKALELFSIHNFDHRATVSGVLDVFESAVLVGLRTYIELSARILEVLDPTGQVTSELVEERKKRHEES